MGTITDSPDATPDAAVSNSNIPPTFAAKTSSGRPSSDVIAQFITSRDFRLDDGTGDLSALTVAFAIGGFYNPAKNCAWPSLTRLAEKLGVHASTVCRHTQSPVMPWTVVSGDRDDSNRYELSTVVMKSFATWYDGSSAEQPPTRISATYGWDSFTPKERKSSVIEPVPFDYDEATALWLIPGSGPHMKKFMESDDNAAEKLAAAGVDHSRKAMTVLGALSYPDLDTAGLSLLLSTLLNTKTGWASVEGSYFGEQWGISERRRSRLNAKLVASGLWNVERDKRTKQTVYTLTDLALAQVVAYWEARKERTEDGRPSGARVRTRTVVKDIEARVTGMHAYVAEALSGGSSSFTDHVAYEHDGDYAEVV